MLRYLRHPAELERASIVKSMERAKPYVRGITLDVGCGSRPYESILTGDGVRYIGLDRKSDPARPLDVCGDSLALPVQSGCIDTVVSNQVIEHVKDPRLFVREIARVLKPGGYMVLTAPQLWCLHEKPYDYFRFTRYGLELLCQEAGLDVELLEERGGAWAAIAQMAALMVYLPQESSGWRIHLARPLFGFLQAAGAALDKLFPQRDLTLGYLVIARKR